MKKFKLIKEYPGSPKLGTIENVEKVEEFTKFGSNGHYIYNIANSPEFWEEVVEVNYKILSFLKDEKVIRVTSHIGDACTLVPNDDPDSLEWLLSKGYTIHSLKRLSDDEVFTVGDRINIEGCDKIITIEAFNVLSDTCTLLSTLTHIGSAYLKHFSKVKQPLFTTEDGVVIYEGDAYVELIVPGFHNKLSVWNYYKCEARPNIRYDQEGNRKNFRLWFSTREIAEEYTIVNKKQLSFRDVEHLLTKKGRETLLKQLKS